MSDYKKELENVEAMEKDIEIKNQKCLLSKNQEEHKFVLGFIAENREDHKKIWYYYYPGYGKEGEWNRQKAIELSENIEIKNVELDISKKDSNGYPRTSINIDGNYENTQYELLYIANFD